MRLGLGLGLFGRRRSADPLAGLPAAPEVLLTAAAGYLFQDAARTLPAGVGDPCGVPADRSGHGRDGAASGSARATVIDAGGGTLAVRHDGVDDFYALPALAGPAPGSAFLGVVRLRAAGTYPMLAVLDSSHVELRGFQGYGYLEYLGDPATAGTAGTAARLDEWLRVIGRAGADGTISLTVNGVTGSPAAGTPFTLLGGGTAVGARPDGSFFAALDWTLLALYARDLTAYEATAADALLTRWTP